MCKRFFNLIKSEKIEKKRSEKDVYSDATWKPWCGSESGSISAFKNEYRQRLEMYVEKNVLAGTFDVSYVVWDVKRGRKGNWEPKP
jgi:hypothetical protein